MRVATGNVLKIDDFDFLFLSIKKSHFVDDKASVVLVLFIHNEILEPYEHIALSGEVLGDYSVISIIYDVGIFVAVFRMLFEEVLF